MKTQENLLPVPNDETDRLKESVEPEPEVEKSQSKEVEELEDNVFESEDPDKSIVVENTEKSEETVVEKQVIEEEEEMNRWNASKLDAMPVRNRPELSAEQCEQLLLSLRELTEWIIKKETELSSQPSIGGDVAVILKQQEENRNIRRQLEDKRPLIENSLLAGRQYVAKDDIGRPESSDSEGLKIILYI